MSASRAHYTAMRAWVRAHASSSLVSLSGVSFAAILSVAKAAIIRTASLSLADTYCHTHSPTHTHVDAHTSLPHLFSQTHTIARTVPYTAWLKVCVCLYF